MGITFSEGHLSRVIMIRVLPGSDMIEGIEAVCKRLDIKTGAGYSNPMDFDGPLEFLAGQGTIGQEEKGDLFIHMHGVLSDKDGNVHGGHLIKGKNPVLLTCEIMISHVEDVRMIRTYDPEIAMKVLVPSENGP